MKRKNRGKALAGLVTGLFAAAAVLVTVCIVLAGRNRRPQENSVHIPTYSAAEESVEEESTEASEIPDDSSKEETAEVSPVEASSEVVSEASSESSAEESSEAPESSTAVITRPEQEVDPEVAAALKEQKVEEILAAMTLEEKVGQMILARFPGTEEAVSDAAAYQFGGYVLFAVDFAGYSEDQVRSKIDACQNVSRIPMLMSVDEEGGTVVRVSPYFRAGGAFKSPRSVYAAEGWDGIDAYTREKCELLLSLHLNMNLAPVADMAGNYFDFMYDRSFGDDVNATSEFVRMTVEIMNEYGVACSLKHFPGYGNNLDTHTGMAVDNREFQAFYDGDLRPFAAGIEAGAGTVMVSHNIVTCMDEVYPASLSEEVHRLLREDLQFDGVIVTDDLSMGAITDFIGTKEAAVQGVIAGNDLLLSSSPITQYEAVLEAVQDGTISLERIEESVRRILRLKYDMGLLE